MEHNSHQKRMTPDYINGFVDALKMVVENWKRYSPLPESCEGTPKVSLNGDVTGDTNIHEQIKEEMEKDYAKPKQSEVGK